MSTKRLDFEESVLDFGFVPLESERIAHDEHEEEPYAQVSSQPAYIQHSRPSRMASACNQVPGRLRRFHVVPVMASMAWPAESSQPREREAGSCRRRGRRQTEATRGRCR